MSSPQVAEPNQDVGKKFPYKMVLLLKRFGLEGFLLHDFGMELLFLDKKPITVRTDKFLLRGFRSA